MQRPHTPVCGWAPETLLLHAHSGTVLQYHLPATPAWLTSVDGELTGWLAGWLAGQGLPAAPGGGHSYSQAHSSMPSPRICRPQRTACWPLPLPSHLQASKARHTVCWHTIIVGGLHLCSATPTPLPETTNCRQHGCPQSVALRPLQGLNRAGEKLCPGHPEWGNTEWQSRGGVRRPGLCKRMQQQHRSALVV
jgi:hypothetical protein